MKAKLQAPTLLMLGLTILSLLGSSSPGLAATLELPIRTVSVISRDSSVHRVLFDFGEIPAELHGELVTNARLTLAIPESLRDNTLAVSLHKVSTPWVGRAPSWDSPWRTPGGDIEAESAVTDVLWKGLSRESLAFDLTEMVRDIADGRAEDCGFLLTVPAHRGMGLRSADLATFGDFGGGTLQVIYAPIKHLGFYGSRSIEERAQRRRAKAAHEETATEN